MQTRLPRMSRTCVVLISKKIPIPAYSAVKEIYIGCKRANNIEDNTRVHLFQIFPKFDESEKGSTNQYPNGYEKS